jgi:hypothetical protein
MHNLNNYLNYAKNKLRIEAVAYFLSTGIFV